jgi:hypothetical protein
MGDDPRSLAELRVIWVALVAMIPVAPIAVVFALASEPAPTPPGWGDLLLWIAVLSSAASWPFIARFRSLRERTARTAENLAQLRQTLLLGIGLAELPMILGILHYALTKDLQVLAGLAALSMLLAFAFRPPEV